MADPHDSMSAADQLNSRLLRQEERVLELTQRLDNAVGKLVSLAQLVRTNTVAASELVARVAQLEVQLKAVEDHQALPPVTQAQATHRDEPAYQAEADFPLVIALLKAQDWEEARRALGRIPTRRLQEEPLLQTLVEAAFSLQSMDLAATVRSLEQAQKTCNDPRLATALKLATDNSVQHLA